VLRNQNIFSISDKYCVHLDTTFSVAETDGLDVVLQMSDV